jgi:hypothetical protein
MYSNHKFSKMVVVSQNTEIQQFLYNNECLKLVSHNSLKIYFCC